MNLHDIETALNVKLATVVTGLIGGVVSLAFIRDLSPGKAVLSVLAGTGAAAYLSPWPVKYFSMSPEGERALTFLTGLCGMLILGGIFKLAERFQKKPLSTIADIRKLKDGEDD